MGWLGENVDFIHKNGIDCGKKNLGVVVGEQ